MSERKRLHPLSIFFNVLKILKDALWPFFLFIFSSLLQGNFGHLIWLLIGIPAAIGLAIGWGILSWLRYQYVVEEGVLKVERGVLFRRKQYIAHSRIQTIDVVEGLFQRLFGVVKLQVQTAGGQRPEAVMSAVSRKDAEQLRWLLLGQADGQPEEILEVDWETVNPSVVEVNTTVVEATPASAGHFYRLSGGRLFIMAITSGSIGVMASFLAAGYSQAGNLFGDDHILSLITEWLFDVPIFITILALFMFSWLLSIAGTMLKYYGFTIRVSGEKLHISRGLLERRQVAIPLTRIQAIRVVESPLRQPFGWMSVYVESAGYGKGKGESTLLFPLLKKSELGDFIASMIPQFQVEYILNRLPQRSMRKYVTLHTFIALLISVPFCFFDPWGYLALLLVPLSAAWGFVKYKESGWTWVESNRMFIMRSRLVERTIVYIPKNRIQYFKLGESPFQRRSELSTIVATVASNGQAGSSFKLKHIASEDSSYLLTLLRP
ncbi:MAG: PH domain-containing protein [Paenibacillaceae bacterium]